MLEHQTVRSYSSWSYWHETMRDQQKVVEDIGLPVTISYGLSLCFPKGLLQTVRKTKSNTLSQGSPVISASLEMLSLRIPLVLSTSPDDSE